MSTVDEALREAARRPPAVSPGQSGQRVHRRLGECRMGERLVQDGSRAYVPQRPEPLHTGQGDPAVGVVGAQPAPQGGDQRRYGLGGAQLDQEPYGMQRVGDAQFVGGERGRRAGRARIAEAGERVRRGRAALDRKSVV